MNTNEQRTHNLTNRAVQCMEKGRYFLALSLLKDVLAFEPKYMPARKYLRATQIALFKSQKLSKFAVWVREMKVFLQKLHAAKFLRDPDKRIEALNAVEELLEANPFNPVYIDMAVTAANQANMPELAAFTVEVVSENSPASDVKLLEKAATYYKLAKQWTKARDVYKKILEYSPSDQRIVQLLKNAEAQCTIADGWEQNAGREGATRDLLKDKTQAEQLDRQNAANIADGDVDTVAKLYLSRIAQNSKDVNSYRALARTYMKAKRFGEAIDALTMALTVTGADPELDRMLSTAKLSKYEADIKAAQDAGDEDLANNLLGEQYRFMFEDLKKRVEKYPNDLHLRYELGSLYCKYDQYDEAIEHLQLAQKSPKDRLDALYLLALCFINKGQTDLGVMQLETALSQLPTMNELKKKVMYQLGLCAEDAGDDEKAYEYYRDIYAADIGFADLNGRMMVLSKAIKYKKEHEKK